MSFFEGYIAGGKELKDKIAAMEPRVRKNIEDTVALGILAIHGEAIRSINAHMSKGATYGDHRASKPGSPPNTDTGNLVKSIEFEIDKPNLEGIVGSNSEYAAALEFGTSTMEPRPWLGRAFRIKIKEIVKSFEDSFRKGVKP